MGFEFTMMGFNVGFFFFQASTLDYTLELLYPLYFLGTHTHKKIIKNIYISQSIHRIYRNTVARIILGNIAAAGPLLQF